MLDNYTIHDLQKRLIVKCGEVIYNPVMYLVQGMIPQLEVIYAIYGKSYKFTIPVYLFESYNRYTVGKVDELIEEIKRNVKLAHKRGENLNK